MVRLRAEAQLGGNQILLELERHLFLHKNKLEIYQNMYEKDFKDQKEQDRVLFIHKKILELGINLEKGWIDWLEDVIPQLQQFENS